MGLAHNHAPSCHKSIHDLKHQIRISCDWFVPLESQLVREQLTQIRDLDILAQDCSQ